MERELVRGLSTQADPAVPPRRSDVLGVSIDRVTPEEAQIRILELAAGRKPAVVVTTNLDHVALLRRNPRFRAAYNAAAMRLADGMPLCWLSRLNGSDSLARVTGCDLVPALIARAGERRIRLGIIGSSHVTVQAARERITREWPEAQLCLSLAPPLNFESDPALVLRLLDEVMCARPQLIFLCLGAPRAEVFASEVLAPRSSSTVVCVGSAIEVFAGQRPRAPEWMQQAGGEWLFRFIHEPRRLFGRYFLRDMTVLAQVPQELRRQKTQARTQTAA